MKTLTRLHTCIAATIVLLLYLSWLRPPSHFQAGLQKVWKSTSHRLVVFGDDWSDVGEYRVSPPPRATTRDRDPDRGDVWTEALCRELSCDSYDNFARSKPANVEIATIGSVVDSEILANATDGKKNHALALFDFRTQVQQFLGFEKGKGYLPSRLRRIDEWILFTVFFGVWDLLEYAELEKEDAVHAIDRSIEELFHNLDVLAEHVYSPVKVVIPKAMDPTFLPVFQGKRDDTTSVFAHNQHKVVFLWTAWNTALSQAAKNWKHGEVYMLDTNDIVMNQVRAKQLYLKYAPDGSGSTSEAPLFDEVEQPCLSLKSEDRGMQAAGIDKCSDPARHLFWDSMHLSGAAHQLIGQDAARLVRENITINLDARVRALHSATNGKSDGKEKKKGSSGFNLKFPPGY